MHGNEYVAVSTDNQGKMESEGEVASSSKASKIDVSLAVPRQEAASIVVIEEVDIGVPAIVQMSM